MDFKRPTNKYDSFDSPANRKKFKASTTISSPEIQQNVNQSLFNDNFSQFFHSQFIRLIDGEKLGENTLNTNVKSNRLTNSSIGLAKLGNYNFTQCIGFSQTLSESQFEQTIQPGQDHSNENSNQHLISQCLNAFPSKKIETNYDEFDEIIDELQSSQIFLQEVNALHLNITSMIDETLLANKSYISDKSKSNTDVDRFELYTSITTQSEYMQMKRSNYFINTSIQQEKPIKENNTESLEDQLLANFDHDKLFENSDKLNECIDPNSSAIASLLNDNNVNNVLNLKINQMDSFDIDQFDQTEIVKTKDPKAIKTNKQHAKPVTAANFYTMGQFFGLPIKVKDLIKNYKQIDDLYGKLIVRMTIE